MSYGLMINHPYNVTCPFVKETYEALEEDGPVSVPSWRPGVRWEHVYPDDSRPVADGIGLVTYWLVSIHKLPAPYPARVFFTRKWIDPDGKVFGKNKLHIMTVSAFKRRLQSYKFAGWEATTPDDWNELVEAAE